MAEVAQFAVAMFCNAVLFKVVRSWLQQAKRVQQEPALFAAGLVSASPLLALLSHKELNLCKVLLYTRAVLVCVQKLVALGVLSRFSLFYIHWYVLPQFHHHVLLARGCICSFSKLCWYDQQMEFKDKASGTV